MTYLALEIAPHIVADRSLRGIEHDLGVYSQGGKGRRHVKPLSKSVNGATGWLLTPGPLIYASRMAAKVDSAAVQDGYQLYSTEPPP
jgi:uncharacterized protein